MEKKLVRSTHDRMIAGVCAGIAEYFGLSVTLIRLVFVAIEILTAGIGGIIAYAILWMLMPEDRSVAL